MDFMKVVPLALVMLVTIKAQSNVRTVSYSMTEEEAADTEVGSIPLDAGLITGQSLQYNFLPQSTTFLEYFAIDANTGLLKTAKVIDRDTICPHMMTCEMTFDVGALAPDRSFTVIKVTVTIVDLNDNAPVFSEDRRDLVISETAIPDASSFALPSVLDPDSGSLGIASFDLRGGSGKFRLQTTNGTDGSVELRLVLLERLDREVEAYYAMTLIARDGGRPQLTGSLAIAVTVLDANDHNPVFVNQTYTAQVREDAEIDVAILGVKATDEDEGNNGEVVYTFDRKTLRQYGDTFDLNNVSGVIRLKRKLDYETIKTYNLQVTAEDRGASGVPAQAKVIIEVVDINDHRPTISVNSLTDTGRVEVPENSDAGGFVAHVAVEDADSGANGQVTCRASGGPFRLESLYQNVFTITTTEVLDREKQSSYSVTLICTDGGTPSLTSSTDVRINIMDQNDNAPRFTQSKYSASVWENNSVGIPVVQVNATDADTGENANLTYSLEGPFSELVHINPHTGIVTAASSLDFETIHTLDLIVVARDHGQPATKSATASLTISIVDTNDEPPRFDKDFYETEILENYIPDTNLVNLSATDVDSHPFNEIAFSLDGDPEIMNTFHVDARTGAVTLKRALDREYKSLYVFKAMASNVGYPDVFSRVDVHIRVLDVNDNAPTIIFPSLTNNTVQVASRAPNGYFFTRVEAKDADDGINAQLTFSFARIPLDNMFDIDARFGAISLRGPARESRDALYTLMIEVRDEGNPPKTAVTELNVIINKTLPFIMSDTYGDYPEETMTSAGAVLSQSETILISLAVVTLLLVTILVVAIVLVRRRQYKGDDDIQNDAISVDLSSSNESRSHKDSSNSTNTNNLSNDSYDSGKSSFKKEVKFSSTDSESLNTDTKENGSGSFNGHPAITLVKLQNDLGKERGVKIKSQGCYNISSGMVSTKPASKNSGAPKPPPRHRIVESPEETLSRPWGMSKKDLVVHKLLQRMSTPPAEDSDSASGCSAEVSNTDSGRGPSEDGDRASPSPDIPSLSSNRDLSPSRHSHSKGRGATSPSTLRKGSVSSSGSVGTTSQPHQGQKRPWSQTRQSSQVNPHYKPQLRTIVEPDNLHVYYTDYANQRGNRASNTDPLLPPRNSQRLSHDFTVPPKSRDVTGWPSTSSQHRGPQKYTPDTYSLGNTSTLDDSDGASTTSGSYILDISDTCRPTVNVGQKAGGSFV